MVEMKNLRQLLHEVGWDSILDAGSACVLLAIVIT